MKIIDFEHLGNAVLFYLGSDDLTDWYGDDWNDTPYEHNAGSVYSDYVSGYKEIAFPFNYAVLEPKDGEWSGNSRYSKDDMRARKVPCIIAVPMDDPNERWEYDRFTDWVGSDKAIRFYMGDEMEPSDEMEVWHGNKA